MRLAALSLAVATAFTVTITGATVHEAGCQTLTVSTGGTGFIAT